MNIDRNNYEEYFLLFADNELTDSEKVEVMMFLKNNRDLEEEFNTINYTVSRPDTSVHLSDKSFLLKKNEEPFITQKNYEEVFVLYHDNELTNEQRLDTRKFLDQHSTLKEEFDLIGLARLTPENLVVFPAKKDLYKKEKDGRVIPLFWKLMAAAVFISFGLWILQAYFNNKKETPTEIVHSLPQKKVVIPGKNIVPQKKDDNAVAQPSSQNSQVAETEINHSKKMRETMSSKKIENGIVKTSVKKTKPVEEKVDATLENKSDDVAITNTDIKSIPAEQIKTNEKISLQNPFAQNENQKTIEVPPVMYAQTASYVQEANSSNENYVFYDIKTDQFRKTKVGSFIKKVKRIIERNNPISRLIGGEDKQVASN